MVKILASSSGVFGMAGGQAVDLAAAGKKMTETQMERMHLLKTGALIKASVMLGYQLADLKDWRFAWCIRKLRPLHWAGFPSSRRYFRCRGRY